MRVAILAFASGAAASTSYLTWMADSFIWHGVKATSGYGEATLYDGYEAAYALTSNEMYVAWYRGQIDDVVVLNNGSIRDWRYDFYSLDNYRIGNNILWWYERTRQAKYRKAADVIRAQLDRHPRTPTGGFWHRQPNYPNQMWLDGIFMADSFYAKWTSLFDAKNKTAWDDIARQYDNIDAHTRNHTSNLLVHGYDESKKAVWADPVTGAAPLVWSRAVGWYFMSLLEVIPLFPESHRGRERLIGYFTTLAEGLKRAQDEKSGGWWLIMSEPYPGAQGNYIESSASAMFAFGWLKGIRLGLLSVDEYAEPAQKAYNGLVEQFMKINDDDTLNWEGTVQVGSLSSNATYQYYTSVPLTENDHRGAGSFMLASYEWERRK
ncbi:glycoside hydrolase family 105 protein [Hypoxylon trugodes]|uniref:glycoside hydrolase family 105 protein n=1 Tax=Hypoxylon trugodes TaxID=326681 RepID=UPI00219E6831|nr:glycoside hydrolase family 105 protein [Hypoxylon trugodes]KAI1384839.1 glycoside hydrolase family 105 protein [Hypoxylon trugodes]